MVLKGNWKDVIYLAEDTRITKKVSIFAGKEQLIIRKLSFLQFLLIESDFKCINKNHFQKINIIFLKMQSKGSGSFN